MINIGLHGFSRSGKTSVAEALARRCGFGIVSIADYIKERALEVDYRFVDGTLYSDLVAAIGVEAAKDHPVYGPEVRQHLQDLALLERQTHGEDVYVRVAARKVAELRSDRPGLPITVPDIRYPSDAAWLRSEAGITQIWRVDRVGGGAANGHVSERPLPPMAIDARIENRMDGLDRLGDLTQICLDTLLGHSQVALAHYPSQLARN